MALTGDKLPEEHSLGIHEKRFLRGHYNILSQWIHKNSEPVIRSTTDGYLSGGLEVSTSNGSVSVVNEGRGTDRPGKLTAYLTDRLSSRSASPRLVGRVGFDFADTLEIFTPEDGMVALSDIVEGISVGLREPLILHLTDQVSANQRTTLEALTAAESIHRESLKIANAVIQAYLQHGS